MVKMMFVTPDIDRAYTWNLLSDKLQKKGIEVSFVSYAKECYLFFKKKSKECIYLADEIDKYKIKGDLKKHLVKIEKKYNIPSLELFLTGDLEHSKMRREKAYAILIKHFYFWEEYLRKNKIDFIAGATERFVHMVPKEVSKKYKTQYIGVVPEPLPGRFSITRDLSGHLSALDEYWRKNRVRALTKKERKNATRFIQSFRQKSGIPFVAGLFSGPKIDKRKIKFFLNRAYTSVFIEKGRFPYMDIFGGTNRYLLKTIRAHAAKKYYSKFNQSEKYVFYPLHVPDDAQIIVRAPQYINQVYVIENIARSLPIEYWLYVKEHPGDIGGTPLKELKKITELPNVKLLSPFENSLKIIKNSTCVITINSTVGWEALLLKKPVINLGKAFYEISGLTYPLRDLSKLPEMIRLASRVNPIKEETLIKFVNAVLATTYPGDLLRTTLYFSDRTRAEIINRDENIKKVADGICDELKQWGHKQIK